MLNNDVMFSDLNLASGLFRKVLKNLDPMKLSLRHITILNVPDHSTIVSFQVVCDQGGCDMPKATREIDRRHVL